MKKQKKAAEEKAKKEAQQAKERKALADLLWSEDSDWAEFLDQTGRKHQRLSQEEAIQMLFRCGYWRKDFLNLKKFTPQDDMTDDQL